MSKAKEKNCEFEDVCNCKDNDYRQHCGVCRWFRVLDSGYGRCTAVPEAPVVPWCKFICVHFTLGGK